MTLRPGILLRREKGQPEGHAVKGKTGKLRVAGTDRKTWNAAPGHHRDMERVLRYAVQSDGEGLPPA
jgi:hypothetical protein